MEQRTEKEKRENRKGCKLYGNTNGLTKLQRLEKAGLPREAGMEAHMVGKP